MTIPALPPDPALRRPCYTQLYFQVIVAIVAGALLGHFRPDTGEAMKPLGDGFIKLVKMIIAPVIFLSVVSGIAGMRELSTVGRVAAKAFGYFLFFSTLALIVGLIVANVVRPGAGMNIDPSTLDAGAVASYAKQAHDTTLVGFLMAIVPTTMVSALTEGSILQTLFVAILFGIATSLVGKPAEPVLDLIERLALIVFRLVGILMRAAPIGAFGAIAFTIGKYGVGSLVNLGALVATFYFTSIFFVLVVLGTVARLHGFSILRLIGYLKAELLLVLGTSSSEAALPNLIAKLEDAGCDKGVVGLVVPTGYSFNLDGTNIYMTLAALFIAQAYNVDLTLGQELALLGVAMLSSKGAAGVTGAGFITLAATLSIVPSVPVAGMALILGVDRFMSECRSLTNFMGNAVAAIVVSRWENKLDLPRLSATLAGRSGGNAMSPLRDIALAIAATQTVVPAAAQSVAPPATTTAPVRVLFVGNSFTYGANSPVKRYRAETVTDLNGGGIGGVPALFKAFTEQAGLRYAVSLETVPGMGLDYHYRAKRAVIDRAWDVVILQGHSLLDVAAPGDPASHIANAAALAAMFTRANPRVDVELMATWSRADQVYRVKGGRWYGTPIAAMAGDLRAASDLARRSSRDIHGVLPVGEAWTRAIAAGIADPDPYDGISFGQIDLWSFDQYHASAYGYYLEALVVFGRVTKRDPRALGAGERAAEDLGIAPDVATALQRVAYEQLAAG